MTQQFQPCSSCDISVGDPCGISVGDRCSVPHYGNGTVQPPKWEMPYHHLIRFDDGQEFWMFRDILQPPVAAQVPKRQRRTQRKVA